MPRKNFQRIVSDLRNIPINNRYPWDFSTLISWGNFSYATLINLEVDQLDSNPSPDGSKSLACVWFGWFRVTLRKPPIEKEKGSLVGGFSPTHLKNMRKPNWIISPGRGENKKYLKPPPSGFDIWYKHNRTEKETCWEMMIFADCWMFWSFLKIPSAKLVDVASSPNNQQIPNVREVFWYTHFKLSYPTYNVYHIYIYISYGTYNKTRITPQKHQHPTCCSFQTHHNKKITIYNNLEP